MKRWSSCYVFVWCGLRKRDRERERSDELIDEMSVLTHNEVVEIVVFCFERVCGVVNE